MLAARTYADRDRGAWDRFVLEHPGSHPAQRRAWLEFTERSYGLIRHAWVAEEGGEVRGVLPLFGRRREASPALFSAPGGLLAADADAAAALLAVIEAACAGGAAASVELRDQRQAWPGLATSTEHCTQVLTLARDPETQWGGFDPKLRNQIRKAQRAGFTVRWGRDQVDGFYRVMLENMRDLGTPLRRCAWFRELAAVLGDSARVLVIERGGEPLGAMLLVVHRGAALDIWASSLRRAFADCPNQMLYWEAIQAAIGEGLRAFDFGRSQFDTGTFRFKAQWGAETVPLFYQYRLRAGDAVPRFAEQRQRFDFATRLWQRLPLPLARLLGEPIRRRFPELL